MAYDVLDTAKKLGWTEASGLKPGEYFASTGQTDAFRAEKLKDSGGTVGGYTGAAPTVPAATTTAAPTTTTAAPVTSTSGKGLMGGIGAGSYADKWGLTSDQVAQLAAMTNFQLGAGGGGNAGGQVGADGKAVGGLGKAL
ncbi:MAG: hypothetical protein Q7J57_14765, partial [Gemmobacter sp.]|nr:hypothetical protein [Gemmobacter sp.]